MRRLPPLTALEAFMQVARLGSIKAGAEELALSSPALSRRVQTLERFFGRTLFERRHQALVLTEDGEELMGMIAPIMDSLSIAVEDFNDGELMRLRLGVLPLFATQKLMPHLCDLREKHPLLHIDMDTAPHSLARLGDGLDVAIAIAREIDPALYARRLGKNRVYAIAGRNFAEGKYAITRPEHLAKATVLIHRDMPETFDAWRASIGLPTLKPAAVDHFDSGQLMLEAAAAGLGVAFMHDHHLEDAHDERLVRLFNVEVESPYSYWFACRPKVLKTRPVRIFHDWLVDLFESTR